jgi:DNA-binding FadR family transcriptional regulator
MVKRTNLHDLVAAELKRYIVQQRLKPGDRLPTEHALAEQFGVSRVSVREATKALGFLGILNAAPRRGLTVGTVAMDRVTEYLGFHFAVSDYPLETLLDSRIVIETGALPFVMQRLAEEPGLYEHLNAMTADLRRARDMKTRIAGDLAFHHALLEVSGLSPLVAFNDLLQVFFDRFRKSLVAAEWVPGIAGHQRIIDALRDGQLPAAIAEMRAHLEYHRGSLQAEIPVKPRRGAQRTERKSACANAPRSR